MTGAESFSKNSRFTGYNALSHAFIQYPPLRFQISGSRFFYDDGNKLIISLISDQVFSWKVIPYDPHVSASSDTINEGPVLSIRYSFDLKLLAIQRSRHEIQIWHRESGYTFSQKCRPELETFLGFFWSDHPSFNIVFVKKSGLDFCVYNSRSRSIQLVETKKLNITWYIYTHESRLVLLASGMQCENITGYQLSSSGTIRLPRFDMVMAKSEVNNKPILAAEDVHIITVYGRIYCMQLDNVAMLLHVFRFYRDAVVQQGSLPVHSSRIAVTVIDNVLLVHQVEAKVVILYDLFSDSLAPISAPLPLLLKGFSKHNLALPQSVSLDSRASESKQIGDTELPTYGDHWIFLVPDLVCDVANGVLWKIRLDLEAISTSSSEVPRTLEFLQRRKLEAEKAKQLCLSIVRNTILERKPVSLIAKALDILLIAYAHAIKSGSYYKRTTVQDISPFTASNPSSELGDNAATSTAEAFGRKQESGSDTGNESCSRSYPSNLGPEGASSTSSHNLGAAVDETENANSLKLNASSGEVSSIQQLQISQPSDHPLNSNASELHQSLLTSSAATSASDLHTFVFAPVEEEMTGDRSYLISILVEFLRRANLEKIKVHTDTYTLMIQILARDERYVELGLFISNKIIEPSKEVAFQLLECGRTRKLGMTILRQLSFHHDYVLLLVQEGCYLEALRYARKNMVTTIQPAMFLEAAYGSKDPQHIAAVLRFFSDFVPGFKNTNDYHTYHQIFAEMNS